MKLSTIIVLWFGALIVGVILMCLDLGAIHYRDPKKAKSTEQPLGAGWKDVLKEPYGAKLTQGIEQVQIVLPAEIYGTAWTNVLLNFEDEFAIHVDNLEWASEYCRMKLLVNSNSPTIFHFNLVPK